MKVRCSGKNCNRRIIERLDLWRPTYSKTSHHDTPVGTERILPGKTDLAEKLREEVGL